MRQLKLRGEVVESNMYRISAISSLDTLNVLSESSELFLHSKICSR